MLLLAHEVKSKSLTVFWQSNRSKIGTNFQQNSRCRPGGGLHSLSAF